MLKNWVPIKCQKVDERQSVIVPQSQSWHLKMSCFVWQTVQNPNKFSLLPNMIKKSMKSIIKARCVCVRHTRTSMSSYHLHKLIKKFNLLWWQQGAMAEAWEVKKRLFLQLEAERQLFVWPAMKSLSVFCLWCSQALGQVSDRKSLCAALCPLPGSYREAVLYCFKEKQHGNEAKHALLISSAGWRGHCLRGVQFFQLLTLIGLVIKMFFWNKKFISVILITESYWKLKITKLK